MDRENANHDNADAGARQPNDTSGKLQRDAHAKNPTTATARETKSFHSRTDEYRRRRNKGKTATPPIFQENNTYRTDPVHRSTPRNA